MREKIQERRERSVQKFVVDLRFDAEELPYLPILESDFQDVIFCVVRERLHFRIVDLNSGDVERRDEVHAVLHPLFALPAKHHGAKNLGRSIYRTSVWYGKHPLYMGVTSQPGIGKGEGLTTLYQENVAFAQSKV